MKASRVNTLLSQRYEFYSIHIFQCGAAMHLPQQRSTFSSVCWKMNSMKVYNSKTCDISQFHDFKVTFLEKWKIYWIAQFQSGRLVNSVPLKIMLVCISFPSWLFTHFKSSTNSFLVVWARLMKKVELRTDKQVEIFKYMYHMKSVTDIEHRNEPKIMDFYIQKRS